MNEELKKSIYEAMEYYEFYKSAKPYIKFANFLESIKLEENQSIIESLNQGVNVILEGYIRDYMNQTDSPYAPFFDIATKLYGSPEGKQKVKNAENILGNKENKDVDSKSKDRATSILLQSLYNEMAHQVEKTLDRKSNSGKVSAKAEQGNEIMGDLAFYVLKEIIPSYDSSKGAFFPYARQMIVQEVEKSTRKELGIPNILTWKAGHNYEWKSNNSYGEVRYGVDVVNDGKQSTTQKVFRRIGPERYIPEELRDVPPNDPEVSDYWREQASDRSKDANTIDLGMDTKAGNTHGDALMDRIGREDDSSGSSNFGGISAETTDKQKNPEQELSTKQSLQKIMSKTKNIIDANVKEYEENLVFGGKSLSEEEKKSKAENLRGYLYDRLQHELQNTDRIGSVESGSKGIKHISTEEDQALKKKYNIADTDRVDQKYANVVSDMREMGKKAFA
jgi:hypothetical protein